MERFSIELSLSFNSEVKRYYLYSSPFSAVFSLKYAHELADSRVEVEEDRSKLGLAFRTSKN
jgi:hypothetical protein